jgi:hypothetical protein
MHSQMLSPVEQTEPDVRALWQVEAEQVAEMEADAALPVVSKARWPKDARRMSIVEAWELLRQNSMDNGQCDGL